MKKMFLALVAINISLVGCQQTAIEVTSTPPASHSPTPAVFKPGKTLTISFEAYPPQPNLEKSVQGTVNITLDDLQELYQINQTTPRAGKKFVLALLTVEGKSTNTIPTGLVDANTFGIFWYYLTNGINGYAHIKREEEYLSKTYSAAPLLTLKLTDPIPHKSFALFELDQNFPVQQLVIKWKTKNNFEQQAISVL